MTWTDSEVREYAIMEEALENAEAEIKRLREENVVLTARLDRLRRIIKGLSYE